MPVRSGSGKEGAAASSLLPGRVTFPSQAGRGSRCGAAPLRWHRVTASRAAPCQLPATAKGQEALGGWAI